jgi:hypothetical protein
VFDLLQAHLQPDRWSQPGRAAPGQLREGDGDARRPDRVPGKERQVAIHVLGRRIGDNPAPGEDHQTLHGGGHLLRSVTRDDESDTVLGIEFADEREHPECAPGIQLRRGLVQHHETRSCRKSSGQGQTLLLSPGEGVRMPGPQRGQPDRGQRRLDAEHDLGPRHAEVLQGEGDLLFDRGGDQLGGRILQHERDPGRLFVDRMVQRVPSLHEQPAVKPTTEELGHRAVQGEAERGFARACRTRQSDDFPGPDIQIDIQQGRPFRPRVFVGDLTKGDERDRHDRGVTAASSVRPVASRATWSAARR